MSKSSKFAGKIIDQVCRVTLEKIGVAPVGWHGVQVNSSDLVLELRREIGRAEIRGAETMLGNIHAMLLGGTVVGPTPSALTDQLQRFLAGMRDAASRNDRRIRREVAAGIVQRVTDNRPGPEWPDVDAEFLEVVDAAGDLIDKSLQTAEERGIRNGRIAERANILGHLGINTNPVEAKGTQGAVRQIQNWAQRMREEARADGTRTATFTGGGQVRMTGGTGGPFVTVEGGQDYRAEHIRNDERLKIARALEVFPTVKEATRDAVVRAIQENFRAQRADAIGAALDALRGRMLRALGVEDPG